MRRRHHTEAAADYALRAARRIETVLCGGGGKGKVRWNFTADEETIQENKKARGIIDLFQKLLILYAL